MATGGRLLSVLQHLAKSHGSSTSLKERSGVLQASLYLVAPELPIKHLATDLIRHCKLQSYNEVSQYNEHDHDIAVRLIAPSTGHLLVSSRWRWPYVNEKPLVSRVLKAPTTNSGWNV